MFSKVRLQSGLAKIYHKDGRQDVQKAQSRERCTHLSLHKNLVFTVECPTQNEKNPSANTRELVWKFRCLKLWWRTSEPTLISVYDLSVPDNCTNCDLLVSSLHYACPVPKSPKSFLGTLSKQIELIRFETINVLYVSVILMHIFHDWGEPGYG